MVYVCIHVPFTKSQGNDSFCVRWNRQIYRWTDLSMTVIYWWLTFVDLATYQFWFIISSPNFHMHSNLASNRCLRAFYEGIVNMHSNLIYIKWNQKFTGKLDIYTCVIILLHLFCCFREKHGFEIKRRENCLRTLFPFLALGENIKNETAQIGAKTAQNDTKTVQNPGNH